MMGRYPFCIKLGGFKLVSCSMIPSTLCNYASSSTLLVRTNTNSHLLLSYSNSIAKPITQISSNFKFHHQRNMGFSSSSWATIGTGYDCNNRFNCENGGFLGLSDEQLMSQCEMEAFKASGPGGQHRNKRESAVRLKHLPTGIIAQGMQALLDLIYAVDGSVSDASKFLGMSTGALSRLILSDDNLRMAVNELRASKGMKPLK